MTTDSRQFDPLVDQVERNAELDAERHPEPKPTTVRVDVAERERDRNLEAITGISKVNCRQHLREAARAR